MLVCLMNTSQGAQGGVVLSLRHITTTKDIQEENISLHTDIVMSLSLCENFYHSWKEIKLK